MTLLAVFARHGRIVLVLGLLAGILLPGLARLLEPLIAPLIVGLLFLAALRIGSVAIRLPLRDLPRAFGWVVLLQIVLPLLGVAGTTAAGVAHTPLGMGIVLALAACPLTGSPGLAVLSGADPAPAMRQMTIGTAVLPLTALPVFWLMPQFGDSAAILGASLRLLVIIAVAGGGALLLRHLFPGLGDIRRLQALDGAIALLMGTVVIALMSAVGPAAIAGGWPFWGTMLLVFGLNFGLQISAYVSARAAFGTEEAAAIGVVAGNRNLALFLGALPPGTAQDLLLFVGCYQVPMYLTPLVMGRLYRRRVGI